MTQSSSADGGLPRRCTFAPVLTLVAALTVETFSLFHSTLSPASVSAQPRVDTLPVLILTAAPPNSLREIRDAASVARSAPIATLAGTAAAAVAETAAGGVLSPLAPLTLPATTMQARTRNGKTAFNPIVALAASATLESFCGRPPELEEKECSSKTRRARVRLEGAICALESGTCYHARPLGGAGRVAVGASAEKFDENGGGSVRSFVVHDEDSKGRPESSGSGTNILAG